MGDQYFDEGGGAPPPPIAQAAFPDAGMPGEPPRTSQAAIWSLVLSIIPACITQLIALPLAIVALVKIGNSQGRLTGQPLAIVALVLCGLQVIIAPAFLAVVAAIAIPGMLRSKIGTNEAAAIGTLRFLTTAQEQFKQQCVVDQDGDGLGEYGYLGELSGIDPCRGSGETMAASPFIAAILGVKNPDGVAQKSGYYFVVYLPGPQNTVLQETQGEGDLLPAAADAQETRWCAYAWPVKRGATGNRAFFVSNAGEVYATPNTVSPYDGALGLPSADAAFEAGTGAGLQGGIGLAAAGLQSNDGKVWVPAGS